MAAWRQLVLLLFCVCGIYTAYLTQGVVSERLAIRRFGPQQERMSHLEGLNGAQSFCCFIWAWIILQFTKRTVGAKPGETPAWHEYWKTGITNSIGPALGIIALKNITYSAQVLVKSCKMVPVMIMGSLLHGRRYTGLEYVCMSLIGAGVAMFGKASSHAVESKLAEPNTLLGYSLCFANLAFDGYTNAVQDEINKKHPNNSPLHMMCWMNFWTSLCYVLYLFGFSRSGFELASFCIRHHDASLYILLFCLCGAFGQLFIFLTIKAFGSLTNTLVCTTRKFFNILISVVLNGSSLLPTQWVAVFMVFSGLLTSTLAKRRKHSKPPSKQA